MNWPVFPSIHIDDDNNTPKALCCLMILVASLAVYVICIIWIYRLFRNASARSNYMYLLLTILLCLCILESSASNIYLYFKKLPYRHYMKEQIPLYYSVTADSTLHFLFWSAFWSFVQMHVYKLTIVYYKHHRQIELLNNQWKQFLNNLPLQRPTPLLKYLQISHILSVFFILGMQSLFRETILISNAKSALIEQIIVVLMCIIQLSVIIFVSRSLSKAANYEDKLLLIPQYKRMTVLSSIVLSVYVTALIVWSLLQKNIDYIWFILLTYSLLLTWILGLCYFQTLYVLKNTPTPVHNRWPSDDSYPYGGTSNYAMAEHPSRMRNELKLVDILQTKEGVEIFMRHLMTEFSVENMLSFVEVSQFLTLWQKDNVLLFTEQQLYLAVVWGYTRENVSNDISLLILGYFKLLYEPEIRLHNSEDNDYKNDWESLEFDWMCEPNFNDYLIHFDYLLNKYIIDKIDTELLINISYELRSKFMRFNKDWDFETIAISFKSVQKEIWRLLLDSFYRFKQSEEYKKLVLNKKKNKNQRDWDNTQSNATEMIEHALPRHWRQKVDNLGKYYKDVTVERKINNELHVQPLLY